MQYSLLWNPKADLCALVSRTFCCMGSQLTALHATSGEISSWVDQRNLARQHTFLQVQQQREEEELQRLRREQEAGGAGPSLAAAAAPVNPFAPSPLMPNAASSTPSATNQSTPGRNSTANSLGARNSLPSDVDMALADGPVTSGRDGSNGASTPVAAPSRSTSRGAGGTGGVGGGPGALRSYGFICECFFMTARVLHLGILKIHSDFKEFSQVHRERTRPNGIILAAPCCILR